MPFGKFYYPKLGETIALNLHWTLKHVLVLLVLFIAFIIYVENVITFIHKIQDDLLIFP